MCYRLPTPKADDWDWGRLYLFALSPSANQLAPVENAETTASSSRRTFLVGSLLWPYSVTFKVTPSPASQQWKNIRHVRVLSVPTHTLLKRCKCSRTASRQGHHKPRS